MIASLPEWLSYRLSQPKQKAGSFSLLMIFFWGSSCRRSLPSTTSMAYMTPLIPQQIEWYLLSIGCGLCGTNIHPGHSLRQLTHPGLKHSGIWVLNACSGSLTWWSGCLNEGGGSKVNERVRKISSKQCLDMKECKQKGAPENYCGTSFA